MKHYVQKQVTLTLLLQVFFSFSYAATPWSKRLNTIPIKKYHRSLESLPSCDITKNGELFIINKLSYANDIIFDIGAYHGSWTKHVLAHCSPKQVYTFEPVPESYAQLCKNIAKKNVTHINSAPSNRNSTLTFYHYKSKHAQTMSSLYRRDKKIEERLGLTPTIITVPTVTIDDFCAKQNIPEIDLLKIDTEGAEYDVLQGCQTMLKKSAIGFIQFEYGGTYKDAGITLKQVCVLLATYNYRIFKITRNALLYISRWSNSLENYEYGNFLAISPTITTKYTALSGL